jgi:pyruvyltransferase
MCKRYNREIHFIDIQANPFSVIREIDKCQNILSSSLHGLVFADALNIPNAWSELSDRVSGKGFKFRDYLLSLRRSTRPIVFSGKENLTEMISQMVTPAQAIVAERISGLDGAFQMLQKYLG